MAPAGGPMEPYPAGWRYAADDLERIRWGLRPKGSNDKWFACVEGNDLRIYRSWTGTLCYRAKLTETGIDTLEILAGMPDPPWQLRMARWIIEDRLIGMDVDLP